MVSATSIRNKLANKVFNKLGSDVTVYNLLSSTVDKWGDTTKTYDSGVSVKGVPYNLISEETFYVSFGDLQDGATDMILPYDTELSTTTKISYNGKDYVVKQVEDFIISNESVAKAVRLIPQA